MDCKKCIYCVQEKEKNKIVCENKKIFKLVCDFTFTKPNYCKYHKTIKQYLKELKDKN